MRTVSIRPDKSRLSTGARAVGVDREARIVKGYVVAQLGPFKSEGRGEFDQASLDLIVKHWPKAGLKSRFSHPTESSDGLGKYLGRARDPYLSTVRLEDGKEVPAVRANLHLDKTAFSSPEGNLGDYVLSLAESDPGALSSSLVLSKDEEYRLDKKGSRVLDDAGNPLAPLWRPKRLYASDVVDEGDAVDAFLAPEASPRYTRDYLARGCAMLDSMFPGVARDEVRERCLSWLDRYLNRRYGMIGDKLGATLGGVLEGYVGQMESEESPREVILSQMADAAGLPLEEVSAIVSGQDVPVTAATLEAFCKVLACPLSELVAAAEADGIDFAGGAEEPPTDEPPPSDVPVDPAAPAPMSKTGILRRRLALKEKAG